MPAPLGHWPRAHPKIALGQTDRSGRICPLLGVQTFTHFVEREEREEPVATFLQQLWSDERGQDIAEYAVMLAVILVIVVGTVRLIGSNSNTVFSQVGSAIQ